ncbi:addiction module protein [Parafilimonas terrae]|uniref:Putative addiction module component n=1 Tax=Parafilimonas terrae TaxID=1465490 RepID=A0A1I5XN61_9BACT|nr:addiction module protein [Parafilimonas terrae]SFQ33401.1 Putative addiction module component [Parafilimonas terrae]
MAYDKSELMQLSNEEKRALAFDLLDSIDDEFAAKEIPEWKLNLIKERLQLDKEGPDGALPWKEVKKKYIR